jgi:hypothetical protein
MMMVNRGREKHKNIKCLLTLHDNDTLLERIEKWGCSFERIQLDEPQLGDNQQP